MPSELSKEASRVSTDIKEAVQLVKEHKDNIWNELGVQVAHDELYTTMVLGVAGLIQHERARKVKPQVDAKAEPTTEKSTGRVDPITVARKNPRTPPIPSSRDSVAPRRSKARKPKAVAAKKVKKTRERAPSKPRKAARGRRR